MFVLLLLCTNVTFKICYSVPTNFILYFDNSFSVDFNEKILLDFYAKTNCFFFSFDHFQSSRKISIVNETVSNAKVINSF